VIAAVSPCSSAAWAGSLRASAAAGSAGDAALSSDPRWAVEAA